MLSQFSICSSDVVISHWAKSSGVLISNWSGTIDVGVKAFSDVVDGPEDIFVVWPVASDPTDKTCSAGCIMYSVGAEVMLSLDILNEDVSSCIAYAA
jgi:hypothetical protein